MSIIGLDVGGTNLKAVRIGRDGVVAGRATVSAGGDLPRAALLAAIAEIAGKVADGAPVEAVGLAVGGAIQPDGTMRLGSTNLPNLAGLPLAETFSALLGLPCRVDHDGRTTIRGEAWLGAARGLRNAMSMTFGTGIGAGLLLDGRIQAGSHGGAGEIGVWRLAPPVDGGAWPSFEDIAAPARAARRLGIEFSVLWNSADTPQGAEALAEIMELIGRAIANAHLLLDLDAVILFGGVTAIGEPFRHAVEQAFLRACPPEFQHGLSIRLSTLGPFAGAIGAAALWLREDKP